MRHRCPPKQIATMKKSFLFQALLSALFSMFVAQAIAQVPDRFNYQAVAKDAANAPIVGNVPVRFTILDGSASGTEVYKETHTATADAGGVFALQVGGGAAQGGTLWSNVNWGSGTKFLKVEIDAGSGFVTMGTPQQLVSVPYAQYAKNSSAWTRSGSNVFNTADNVGIGTATPGRKLEVKNNAPQIRLSDSNGSVELYGGLNFQVMNTSNILATFWSGNQATTPRLDILSKSNWDLINSEGDFQIGNGIEKFKIGIALGGGGAGNTNMHTTGNIISLGQGSNLNVLNIAGGKVGIGTTTPANPLHVKGTGYFEGGDLVVSKRIYTADAGDSDGTDIVFGSNNQGSGEWLGSKRTAGGNQYGLDFYTSNQNRLSIRNDGVLSVNDGSLLLKGNNGSSPVLYFQPSGDPNIKARLWMPNGSKYIQFDNLNSTFGGTDPNGGFVFNGSFYDFYAGPIKALYTGGFSIESSGNASKPGGGPWAATSDRRLKQDIRPYADGLKTLLQINPVRFRYNEKSGYDTKPEYVGVIAQEMQDVAPYMVSEVSRKSKEGAAKETYLCVDNSAMTYMLINAVKEQQAEIESLRSQNTTLQSAHDSLEKRLQLLESKVSALLESSTQNSSINNR